MSVITKLSIPRLRERLVSRAHVLQRLDAGLHAGRRLTLVCAPPGFGKTTLLSEWAAHSRRAAIWFTLDPGDNDPIQFLTYLITALQQVDRRIGATAQQILQPPAMPQLQNVAASLINDLVAVESPLLLVFDEYHMIASEAIHELVQFFIEHQPPLLHVAISTRHDPPLPLPRLRARGHLTELRERDLRFTPEEVATFLRQTMGLPLSDAVVAVLETRTEGWPAGLQLAALAIQEDADHADAFVAAFSGADRYVMDYLITEVIERQPRPIRAFLQQTAILDRLSAPLCDAVTGREGSQVLIEQLEQANLFLVPLDHRREWYRYHTLFADFLQASLDRATQALLHQRAAHWFEHAGAPREAVRHALAHAALSGDVSDAVRLIAGLAEEMILQGAVQTVRAWLDQLPEHHVRAHGALSLYKGWVLALSGDISGAAACADAADQALAVEHAPLETIGKLLTLRSFLAVFAWRDHTAGRDYATRALHALSSDQWHWRIIALWTLAEAQEHTGAITAAIATLREARRAGRALGNQVFAAAIEFFLASALNAHGRRREAIAVCEEAIAHYTDASGQVSPVAAMIVSCLGRCYAESDQLDIARGYIDHGRALSEQLGIASSRIVPLAYQALLRHAQGETPAALDLLQEAYRLSVQTRLTDADWVAALEASMRLRQGDVPFALRWAEAAALSPGVPADYLQIEQHLIYCRLLLVQGRTADARRLLARLERFASTAGLYRWQIDVHVLLALAAEQAGDAVVARDNITQALRLAAPEGYIRPFLDDGTRVIALLGQVRPVAPEFVDRVLERAGVAAQRLPVGAALIEPLSDREIEVLRLVAAGLSNQEIASALIIAVATVKRHINHIYSKLDVKSRTQAIAKARELGLFDLH